MHVKTGDEVLVIAGKDKGRKGKIKRALPREERVVVEGLNIVKRHMKARGPGKPGGIIEMEAPLHVSNDGKGAGRLPGRAGNHAGAASHAARC
jgi:large subunit ribosomal protein L24